MWHTCCSGASDISPTRPYIGRSSKNNCIQYCRETANLNFFVSSDVNSTSQIDLGFSFTGWRERLERGKRTAASYHTTKLHFDWTSCQVISFNSFSKTPEGSLGIWFWTVRETVETVELLRVVERSNLVNVEWNDVLLGISMIRRWRLHRRNCQRNHQQQQQGQ